MYNSVIEFIATALYSYYFIGNDFLSPLFSGVDFLVIVHVFSIAFIVFDLALAIAILSPFKILNNFVLTWFHQNI